MNNRRHSGRRFIQLWTNVKRSAAYHSLSLGARCALVELLDKYDGCNNGMLAMGVRELQERLQCSPRGACNFLRELDDAGLARPTYVGAWRGRKASEWRVMFYRCDKTGDLPVKNWNPAECTRGSAKVHQGKRRDGLSAPGEAQKRNSSINGYPLSAPGEAHIHIYQGDSDKAGGGKPWTKPTIGEEPRRQARGARGARL
jgi:hypothetical protein